ncbi:hypothetical protein Thal_0568 [Thermocrinis albus DSM 14484]|uniref:Uncharacterized protein n=1 Tax=Thermocrinis albus (strain DSM 14484 / JCM 11386 / HI 11/12) TaxID=638303 RepID=D3SPW5_THEAH|nr:hypothetical protein [Thermocrinis albus]ADC89202.1 hypothetical protein Thal_0568 [Thermocrinis albus DSM 14484]
MKVLMISFDKSLVGRLKDLLKEYDVAEFKNGEEAVNSNIQYADVIIYDAIAGSISEEDINSMYKQKFKDSLYVILVDQLFPIDAKNLLPHRKVLVDRDKAEERIMDVLRGGEIPEEMTGGVTQMEKPSSKIMIFSLDPDFIKKLKDALGEGFLYLEAKSVREVIPQAEQADILVIDALSGVLAQKVLTELSRKEEVRGKPFVILVDELFGVDVSDVELGEKYIFGRESELSKAVQKIQELGQRRAVAILEEEPVEKSVESISNLEKEPVEKPVESILEELLSGYSGTTYEPTETPQASHVEEKMSGSLREALLQSLPSLLKENIHQALDQEMIRDQIKETLRSVLSEEVIKEAVKDVVKDVLSSVDIASLIREEAYRALKERLREIIT